MRVQVLRYWWLAGVLASGWIALAQNNGGKQIDVGAAQAPLSDAQRTELDRAVKKHDYAAEKTVIDQALAEHPDSFELFVMAGRLAYLEKKPKDAAEALRRAQKIKPLPEADQLTLAIAYQFSGKPAESHAELSALIKLAPKNAEYWYLIGRMDQQNQHLEKAVEEYAESLRLNPNVPKIYEELGQLQAGLGLEDEAERTLEKGAVVNRAMSTHWEWSPLDLGVEKMKANQFSEAEKLFREALLYKPRFSWGHYYMGQLLQKQGRDAEAIAEYKEAAVDDPQLRQTWLALAREFSKAGNHAESDRALEIFKKLETSDNAAHGKKN